MLKWFVGLYGLLSGFMITGLMRLRRGKGLLEDADLPAIAVVVAARNEAKNLPALIQALKDQRYPEDRVSFWIVDDDSSDNTLAIASDAAEADDRFHVLRSDPESPVASPKRRALDTAIRKADVEWIVTTDADCRPGPDWLQSLARFMDDDIGVVVGYAPLTGSGNIVEWLAEGESWSAAALAASGIGLGFPFNAMGRNFAFRRKIYLDLGGYGFGEKMASGDDDLFLQHVVARTNWKAAFAMDPNATVPSRVTPAGKLLVTKARHMSAGVKYAPGWLVIGSLGSLLFMGLGLASIIALLGLGDRGRVLAAWRWKWFFDLLMAAAGLRVLGNPARALLAVATMSTVPFALWVIWPKALFGTIDWKERQFKGGRVPA